MCQVEGLLKRARSKRVVKTLLKAFTGRLSLSILSKPLLHQISLYKSVKMHHLLLYSIQRSETHPIRVRSQETLRRWRRRETGSG